MRFIEARHYGNGRLGHQVKWVVIHDMEAPERKDTAENIANYFATTSTVASAHYNVDVNSVVQSVREGDRAWHAPPLNEESVGVEHAGYARQSRSQWRDDYSLTMLREQSAPLVAEICDRHDIPVRYVDQADLKAGKAGITTHDDVSEAFGASSHWDPGPHFPIHDYIDMVQGGDMPSPQEIAKEVVNELRHFRVEPYPPDEGNQDKDGLRSLQHIWLSTHRHSILGHQEAIEDRVTEDAPERQEVRQIRDDLQELTARLDELSVEGVGAEIRRMLERVEARLVVVDDEPEQPA